MPQKKKWVTPKLIVLVRGKPEERVLTGCKYANVTGQSAVFLEGCETDNAGACDKCLEMSSVS